MIPSYLASVSRAAEQAFDCLLTCIHKPAMALLCRLSPSVR